MTHFKSIKRQIKRGNVRVEKSQFTGEVRLYRRGRHGVQRWIRF